jgi:hypothetical protein
MVGACPPYQRPLQQHPQPTPQSPPGQPPRRHRARTVFPVLVVAALGVGAATYAQGVGKESTEDAFLESHVSNVAARVPGQALRVLVKVRPFAARWRVAPSSPGRWLLPSVLCSRS